MTTELAAPIAPRRNFFIRYWHGEYSLAISYWLINFLTGIVTRVVVQGLANVLSLHGGYHPLTVFGSIVGLWVLIVSIQIWQMVGLWRSAGHYLATHTGWRRSWAYLARTLIILGVASTVSLFLITGYPQIVEASKILFADDPDIPDYTITLSDDGREIHVSGGFKYGLAKDLRQRVEFAPHARVIVFDSVGGRLGEAESVYDLLVEKRLSTAVDGLCASACALAFMGGDNRWLGFSGRIGLHAADFVGMKQRDIIASQQDFERKITRRIGVPAAFFAKAHQVPHADLWYPTRDVLLDNRVLTARFPETPSAIRNFQAMARETEAAIRKTLPKQIDDVTDLVQFEVERNAFVYTMAINPRLVTRALVLEQAKEIENDVRERLCEQDSPRKLLNFGVVYRYRYLLGRERNPVITFDVERCGKS